MPAAAQWHTLTEKNILMKTLFASGHFERTVLYTLAARHIHIFCTRIERGDAGVPPVARTHTLHTWRQVRNGATTTRYGRIENGKINLHSPNEFTFCAWLCHSHKRCECVCVCAHALHILSGTYEILIKSYFMSLLRAR